MNPTQQSAPSDTLSKRGTSTRTPVCVSQRRCFPEKLILTLSFVVCSKCRDEDTNTDNVKTQPRKESARLLCTDTQLTPRQDQLVITRACQPAALSRYQYCRFPSQGLPLVVFSTEEGMEPSKNRNSWTRLPVGSWVIGLSPNCFLNSRGSVPRSTMQ